MTTITTVGIFLTEDERGHLTRLCNELEVMEERALRNQEGPEAQTRAAEQAALRKLMNLPAARAAARADDDLTDDELREVESRYADRTPKKPCPVCGNVDWSLQAVGRGRETWVCRYSLSEHHGGHAGNKQEWEHYRASSREQVSGDHRIAALIAEVRRKRVAVAPPSREPHEPRVLAQIIRAPSADMTGIRVIVDGEVIGTGDYGGEPEDNCEYRDYAWVKELLVTLAKKLGASPSIENVEVDGPTERAASEAYYTAMAAPAPQLKQTTETKP